jgi:riboflavin synthase
MFTGIIQSKAKLIRLDRGKKPCRLVVDLGGLVAKVRPGDSVALDGCCLTATDIQPGGEVSFDVIPETLSRTTLGLRSPGYTFNIELALTPTDRLGGHFVQGHVDGVGRVASVAHESGQVVLTIACDWELTAQMVQKGSVAINGTSLTLTAVGETTFSVALIPTTLDWTNLGGLVAGEAVNIETDMILKYVAKLLGGAAPRHPLTEGFLKEHGFA